MMNEILNKILIFIKEIGLMYREEPINGDTFLPGLKLQMGTLVIDQSKLLYPGDILHEAGHLACMPLHIRATMNDNLKMNDLHTGGELMAIAWSYAACLHLKIDPHIVFHENGYKGGGIEIVKNFNEGRYFGVPLLQWYGMAYDNNTAIELGKKAFPNMINWICKQGPEGAGPALK